MVGRFSRAVGSSASLQRSPGGEPAYPAAVPPGIYLEALLPRAFAALDAFMEAGSAGASALLSMTQTRPGVTAKPEDGQVRTAALILLDQADDDDGRGWDRTHGRRAGRVPPKALPLLPGRKKSWAGSRSRWHPPLSG